MKRLAAVAVLALLLAGALHGSGESTEKSDYTGRPLAEALEELRDRGLRLVYGSNTVQPDMVVSSPVEAKTLRGILDQLLAPHGLVARESAGGILTVVAAPHGAVEGEVRDADSGEPVRNAEVEIIGLLTVRTDAAGRFEIDEVPSGRREIEARKAGYVVERQEIEVPPDDRQRVVLGLDPVARTLEEIVVTPGRVSMLRREPSPEVLWTRADVNRQPHLFDDLIRAVARLPGIASGDFSADFHVRGGERSETLVLIDGLRVYEPYHLKDFQNVFSIFDSNATDAIEVMSGGFTSEYGDRMSGVVEISSVVPLERRTMVGVSFDKVHFLSQGRFGSGDGGEWLVNARRGYLDFLLDSVDTDEEDFDLSPVYYDLFGKVRRRVGRSGLLAFNLLGAADEVDFRNDDDDDDLTSSYSNVYAWLKLDTAPSSRVSQSTVLSYGRLGSERAGESEANHSDPLVAPDLDRTRVRDERTTDVVELRQDWRIELSDRQHVRAGVDVRWLAAEYDYTFSNRVTDPTFTDGVSVTERRFDLQPEGWTYGVYLADRLRLGRRITVEAGVRWDRQTYADDQQVSPRLNFVVELRPSTTLRASWGRYWQSQGIHELQVVDGVDEFHPAQLNEQVTLAVDRQLGGGGRLAAQLYVKRLEDPRPRYENLLEPLDVFPEGQSDRLLIAPDRGRARGLELLFERRKTRLGWWVTYALSEAEDRIGGAYVPRSWDQRHAVTYSVNLQLKERWNLNLAGVHHSGWPATDARLVRRPGQALPAVQLDERNSSHYPDYHRIDLRASRTFHTERGEVKFFFEVTNLLDRDNIRSISDFEVEFAPATGFTLGREFEKWFPRVPSFGATWTF